MKRQLICILLVAALVLALTGCKTSQSSQPTNPGASQPTTDLMNPTSSQTGSPEATQPGATQPDASQPNASQPDASQPTETTPSQSITPQPTTPTGTVTPTGPQVSSCSHSSTQWVQTKAATCEAPAEKQEICNACRKVLQTQPEGQPKGHTWVYVAAVPAGKRTTGATDHNRCKICQAYETAPTILPALGSAGLRVVVEAKDRVIVYLENCADPDLVIPAEYYWNGQIYKTTGFSNNALTDTQRNTIASITFLGSLLTEEYSNFSNATALKTVTFCGDVKKLPDHAFSDCTALNTVTFQGEVKQIGRYAFDGCTSLTQVSISEGLTTIGYTAFRDCKTMRALNLPKSLRQIGASAFAECENLVLTLPQGLQTIGDGAFVRCNALQTVTVPGSVTHIGAGAFTECRNLKQLTLPAGLKTMGDSVFYGCSKLESLKFPEGIIQIGSDMFGGCTALKTVWVPTSVVEFQQYAFLDATGLEEIRYAGTKDQWNAITKTTGLGLSDTLQQVVLPWHHNTGAFTVYCTDGNLKKAVT